MPAPVKFTRRRERRLLALVEAGATVAEACRAVEAARTSIYKHARADPMFAARLRVARLRKPELPDWRASAAMLEAMNHEQWVLPELPDPFAFDPLGAA